MESLRGQLLISSGGMHDPNFRHTVVLIGEHNAEGALGIVLNRALNVTVEEAVPALGELVSRGDLLYQGGPVQPRSPVLLAEVTSPGVLDIPVLESVGFLIGEVPQEAEWAILRARVFAGYSGWGPGQLEAEMALDSWILSPATVEDAFTDDPDLLWSRVLQRKGGRFRQLSRLPFDPSMN